MSSCIDAIMGHVSIRKYKPDPIPEEHLRIILEAGRRAPTDAALHLWTAILVRDPGLRRRIGNEIGQRHVVEAPVFLVFLADLYRLSRLLEYRGEEPGDADFALLVFAAIDAGIAAENMAVAAESLGYGTCFIGAVQNRPRLVARLLGLPRKTYPLFGLTIGVPAERPPRRPRLPLDLLVHENHYRDYSDGDLERAYREMAPITRRRDYLRLLRRYAAKGGYFEERNREMPRLLREMGFRLPCGEEAPPPGG